MSVGRLPDLLKYFLTAIRFCNKNTGKFILFTCVPLYCVISMGGGGTNPSCLGPLKVLQKRIMRLLAGSHYLAHSEPLFARLKILRVDDIYVCLCSLPPQ